jgi:FkbM family methyltransferase
MPELPKEVYIFGSGTFTSRLIGSLNAVGVRVAGIIDWPERAGGFIGGFRIASIEDSLNLNFPVLLGVHNPEANVKNVQSRLIELGVSKIISPPQVVEMLYLKNEILSNYWMGPQHEFPLHRDELTFVNSILSDEKSTSIYESSLRYRQTGQIEELTFPDPLELQYFPNDIPGFYEQLSDLGAFVDMGAYIGDTLKALSLTSFRPEIYLGLEPDMNSFQQLLIEARAFQGKSLCLPLAASESVGRVSFSSGGPSSAVVLGDGIPVQTINLDLLRNFRMSYLKMDIEGSELAALRGSEGILRRDKPVLAISIYHKPRDIVEIPKYLASLGVYDKFYLRCYGDQLFDTVLYCLPA